MSEIMPPGTHPKSRGWTVEDRGHDTPCWIYQGLCGSGNGYKILTYRGKTQLAHRAFYKHHVGPIPDGLVLDHLCRVITCVNPVHLEAVTLLENSRRGKRGDLYEYPSHCPHGHEFTNENSVWVNARHRQCRACKNHNNRMYYQRLKENKT